MNEHLLKASHDATLLFEDLRRAHSAAIDAGNRFAEIAIFDAIQAAVKLEQLTKALSEAAQ